MEGSRGGADDVGWGCSPEDSRREVQSRAMTVSSIAVIALLRREAGSMG